uniref:Uncharacterized protein n=1 Tax=Angiostrongylus cantonensis TaxID=6313 RepID=A0A0K0DFN0_ANGCA
MNIFVSEKIPIYSSCLKFWDSGNCEFVEGIFCVILVGEAIFAQEVVTVLEEVDHRLIRVAPNCRVSILAFLCDSCVWKLFLCFRQGVLQAVEQWFACLLPLMPSIRRRQAHWGDLGLPYVRGRNHQIGISGTRFVLSIQQHYFHTKLL